MCDPRMQSPDWRSGSHPALSGGRSGRTTPPRADVMARPAVFVEITKACVCPAIPTVSGHPKPGRQSSSTATREATSAMQGNLKALSSCFHSAYPWHSHPVLAFHALCPCRAISQPVPSPKTAKGHPQLGLRDSCAFSCSHLAASRSRTGDLDRKWCHCWKTGRRPLVLILLGG